MKHDSMKARARKEAEEEARQDDAQEARLDGRLRKWKRAATWLGMGLAFSVAAVVPFLKGHILHDQWDTIGKRILVLAMAIFVAFVYAAGITYVCWSYRNDVEELHRKFAPPGSKYRQGKKPR